MANKFALIESIKRPDKTRVVGNDEVVTGTTLFEEGWEGLVPKDFERVYLEKFGDVVAADVTVARNGHMVVSTEKNDRVEFFGPGKVRLYEGQSVMNSRDSYEAPVMRISVKSEK